jgi:hypothetical protein
MNSTIFLFLFVAASPLLFMPGIIAWFTRHPRRVALLAGNGVVWLFGFISVRSVLGAGGGGLFVPVPLDLLAWIGLLALAIRKPSPAKPE